MVQHMLDSREKLNTLKTEEEKHIMSLVLLPATYVDSTSLLEKEKSITGHLIGDIDIARRKREKK